MAEESIDEGMRRQICDVVLLEVNIQEFERQYKQKFDDKLLRQTSTYS